MGDKPRKRRLIQRHTAPIGADKDDVADFAASLSITYLECRELGHNWRKWVARYDEEHHSYERALRCTRCRTERWETIGLTGSKIGSHYKYPDGYQTVPGMGRIVGEGRDVLRLESMTRSLVAADHKQARKAS